MINMKCFKTPSMLLQLRVLCLLFRNTWFHLWFL